ncbi:hypothetical protein [Thermus tenuipuniceus]|uniref:hypothetical protein n=1 Tax=Thermus tenuipuniceus TaxID=2078690 RepID=UPI000CF95D3D|nr:hypothetical protein [Thermus tenuipuniceus]
MKREAKLLLEKATDSLVLAIELFNRPHDRGRVSSVLIMLDHAFFKRYSPRAIDAIKEGLKKESADEIWRMRGVKAKRGAV